MNLGQAEAEGAVSTGFEAGARVTLPAWSVGVAAGAGLLLGVLFGRAMK